MPRSTLPGLCCEGAAGFEVSLGSSQPSAGMCSKCVCGEIECSERVQVHGQTNKAVIIMHPRQALQIVGVSWTSY